MFKLPGRRGWLCRHHRALGLECFPSPPSEHKPQSTAGISSVAENHTGGVSSVRKPSAPLLQCDLLPRFPANPTRIHIPNPGWELSVLRQDLQSCTGQTPSLSRALGMQGLQEPQPPPPGASDTCEGLGGSSELPARALRLSHAPGIFITNINSH